MKPTVVDAQTRTSIRAAEETCYSSPRFLRSFDPFATLLGRAANGARGFAPSARRQASVLAYVAFCLATGTSLIARAETAQHRAEVLFREGQRLTQQGVFAAGCVLLAESLDLDPALGTLLNLAVCHEKEGKAATALLEYRRAAEWARQQSDPERENYAQGRALALERTVPRVRVEVDVTPTGYTVSLDGRTYTSSEATLGILVDPGQHTLIVTASDGKPWLHETITVAANSGITTLRVASIGSSKETHPTGPEKPSGWRWGYLVGSIGVAAVATSAALLLRARALDNRSQDDAARANATSPVDEQLKRSSLDQYDSAIRYRNVGFVTLGVGAAGVGAGLYLLLTESGTESPRPSATYRLLPTVHRQGATLEFVTRF